MDVEIFIQWNLKKKQEMTLYCWQLKQSWRWSPPATLRYCFTGWNLTESEIYLILIALYSLWYQIAALLKPHLCRSHNEWISFSQLVGVPGWSQICSWSITPQSNHIAGGLWAPKAQSLCSQSMFCSWSQLSGVNAEFCCLCKRCPVCVLHCCLIVAERFFLGQVLVRSN